MKSFKEWLNLNEWNHVSFNINKPIIINYNGYKKIIRADQIDPRFEIYNNKLNLSPYSLPLADGKFLNCNQIWGENNSAFISEEPMYDVAPDNWADYAIIYYQEKPVSLPLVGQREDDKIYNKSKVMF